MLRAVAKSGGKAFFALRENLNRRLEAVLKVKPELKPETERLVTETQDLIETARNFDVPKI